MVFFESVRHEGGKGGCPLGRSLEESGKDGCPLGQS